VDCRAGAIGSPLGFDALLGRPWGLPALDLLDTAQSGQPRPARPARPACAHPLPARWAI